MYVLRLCCFMCMCYFLQIIPRQYDLSCCAHFLLNYCCVILMFVVFQQVLTHFVCAVHHWRTVWWVVCNLFGKWYCVIVNISNVCLLYLHTTFADFHYARLWELWHCPTVHAEIATQNFNSNQNNFNVTFFSKFATKSNLICSL